MVFQPAGPGGITMVELWQTGGRLGRPDQGGDPTGAWELEPRGRGIAFRFVEMPAGHDPGESGWHTTATIDLDLMLSGRLELAVPGSRSGRRRPAASRSCSARRTIAGGRSGPNPSASSRLMLAVGD